jgi:tetratricopeptide (TPR) repeat protein
MCSACTQSSVDLGPASFVGRGECRDCHDIANQMFAGSDHDWAMDHATPETVLGDFNDAEFTHHGITSKFYTRDGEYYVYTEGEDGVMAEFKIDYIFGFDPLQQYLIEFPGGAYQCLPLCWDARPEEDGGQRWFHVYDQERIAPGDELYWTNINQNWNYMCAECHSTDLKKQYNPETRTYNTTWSEMDVSCEACHGPGSRHVQWADAAQKGDTIDIWHYGLDVQLERRDQVEWIISVGDSIAHRTTAPFGTPQIDICARCHSRRSVITEEYVHGKSILDTHYPSLLRSGLYLADGQIEEEVYVYASFLQSKMHAAGVVCSDCHDAHSNNIYINGDGLCQRCHQAEHYSTPDHHFHNQDSTGARCIPCHMPQRYYMVVDERADHSMRIPRPDLTVSLGVRNACNDCHADSSAQWAADIIEKWYGPDRPAHFAETFASARDGDPRTTNRLLKLIRDTTQSAMVRATAIELISAFPDAKSDWVIRTALASSEPQIRAAAVEAFTNQPLSQRVASLLPLLQDSIRLVRALSARSVAAAQPTDLPDGEQQHLDRALSEYRTMQLINTDHPTGWMNLGNLHMELNDATQAEEIYRKAIAEHPDFIPSYVNLADVYRTTGRDKEGHDILMQARAVDSANADVQHALGLVHVRLGQTDSALVHLKRAVELDPDAVRYAYVYAIGLHSSGERLRAMTVLRQTLKRHKYDRSLHEAMVTMHLEAGEFDDALKYVLRLQNLFPDVAEYKTLENQIRAERVRSG